MQAASNSDLGSARVVRDLTGLFADTATVVRAECELMNEPGFAALYRRRADTASAPLRADWPADSFAAVHRDFQAWYGLTPNFFPVSFTAQASPLEFAASLLAREHDAYHVLCEYETSDREEVALQSFLCAQAPVVFACFVRIIARCSELGAGVFKHLRDLLDSELDREALSRGGQVQPWILRDLSPLRGLPIARVRRELAIEPRGARPSQRELRNTCGGKPAGPYFATHS